jgi:hypothetical protein
MTQETKLLFNGLTMVAGVASLVGFTMFAVGAYRVSKTVDYSTGSHGEATIQEVRHRKDLKNLFIASTVAMAIFAGGKIILKAKS